MPQRDHYEVLGVRRDATPEEIKTAFKKLVTQVHPDRNPSDPTAHERFKEINLAYQVLSNDDRRAMYDRFGHRAEEPGSPFGSGGPFAGGYVDISDIAVDGILGDLLGVFGVGKGDRGDIKRELHVTFEEAAFGCEKALRYDRVGVCGDCHGSGAARGTLPEPCNACNGRGRVRFQQGILPIAVERSCSRCRGTGKTVRNACPICRGSGLVTSQETLRVTVPAGVEGGATKLVANAGSKSRPDRAPGDLEITITVEPHPFFRRSGDDVLCIVPITFTQAALGAEIEVPTLDGKGKLRVPSGTQPGSVLRIKGKGIPHRGGLGRGEQRVEVAIEVPTHLTERQRQLLEDLARELGEDVLPQRRTFMSKLRDLFE
ncbi:MAG TPA: molecular chaperone DnaJ [Polyangiaceae bacterium]|nr:molecular chaperone DnaJ [Polyangiaceae bacterium]